MNLAHARVLALRNYVIVLRLRRRRPPMPAGAAEVVGDLRDPREVCDET